ncbi:MAG: aldo/keto reductase [Prolixibacteraceae bacterium]|nr:aldo/keto reductase [Prolixibacteraceae bacterium]
MKYRKLGRTDFEISTVSLGTWQVGGKWGSPFDFKNAETILNEAIDQGINFIDTADVYGDGNGESEQAVGRVVRSRSEQVYVATKCGRRLNPHVNQSYTPQAMRRFVEESLKNMQLETIDLIQLHCPPTEVYYRPEIFAEFDKLIAEGKIRKLGVSVEKVEEALKAIEFDNVDTVQIIFNMFRQRPAELFFEQAAKCNIGIIARVPLASGLLSGKFDRNTTFGAGDHRTFNRNGEAFDKGETFSGIDYNSGLEAVDELKKLFPGSKLAQLALQWILSFPEVSTVIPGASNVEQLKANIAAAELDVLASHQMKTINDLYNKNIKEHVHHLW